MRKSDADLCRLGGWKAGTVIEIRDAITSAVFDRAVITAVGARGVVILPLGLKERLLWPERLIIGQSHFRSIVQVGEMYVPVSSQCAPQRQMEHPLSEW